MLLQLVWVNATTELAPEGAEAGTTAVLSPAMMVLLG